MIDIERLSDKELQALANRYERIRHEWTQRQKRFGPAEGVIRRLAEPQRPNHIDRGVCRG